MPATRLQSLLDKASLWLSGLCLVHCLILPVAALALPLLGLGLAVDHWLHGVFFALAMPASMMALRLGYRRRQAALPVLLAALGLGLMGLALLGGHDRVETVLTAGGVAVLAMAHLLNMSHRGRGERLQAVPGS
ncbi:MAG: MerC domain-containing protein [Pseudomonadota bacterium]